MTSSDLVDTALALTLTRAADLLLREVESLRERTRVVALQYRDTPMVGRTHGIHAEPITFGLKVLVWYEELGRAIDAASRRAGPSSRSESSPARSGRWRT